MSNPFRYFNSSPEVIRLVVMMYVKYPLSLRNVEDLLFERGIDICHETVRLWWPARSENSGPRTCVGSGSGADRKSTRLNTVTNEHIVCRLLLDKKTNH